MKDLHSFTQLLVNPKFRKFRFEAYAVVAPYPVEFPRVKNACIKGCWKMPTNRHWCQVPPSIKDRLERSGKLSMHKLMVEIEGAMLYLSNCASTVVENVRKRTCWIGEVDIGLMAKTPPAVAGRALLAVPGPVPGPVGGSVAGG